jgi:hypothetical protein
VKKRTNTTDDPRPVSAVSTAVGLSGLFGLAVAIIFARNFGAVMAFMGFPGWPEVADGRYSALAAVAFCGIPMVIWSIFIDKVHLRPSTGIDWKLKRPVADVLDTSIIKIAGLWATWAIIAACCFVGTLCDLARPLSYQSPRRHLAFRGLDFGAE